MSWGRQILGLCGFLALSLAALTAGAVLTSFGVTTWYRTIIKPTWNPPDWIFGPVWTSLFVMMAMAAWLTWRRGTADQPMRWYFAQLIANIAWSALFFTAQRPDLAFFEIVFLWFLILGCVVTFWSRSRLGSLLMIPYLLWVSFALVLNATIWSLNPL